MSDTAQQLENEIEARRASVEETLDKLKQRLSVDQIVDDVGQFLGIENVRGALETAGKQVRENPIPLALIGAGVAWLVMGRGTSQTHAQDIGYEGSDRRATRLGGTSAGDPQIGRDDTSVRPVKSAFAGANETLGNVAGKVRDLADQASDSAQTTMDAIKERAGATLQPLSDRMVAQPLLLGAATIAIGAVIGSALPRTRTEDRLLGPQRDKLVASASDMAAEMGDRLADAAQSTYDAAARAAHDEGLIPESGTPTIAEKVERVATAAVEEASAQVEPVLHGEKDDKPKGRRSADRG